MLPLSYPGRAFQAVLAAKQLPEISELPIVPVKLLTSMLEDPPDAVQLARSPTAIVLPTHITLFATLTSAAIRSSSSTNRRNNRNAGARFNTPSYKSLDWLP